MDTHQKGFANIILVVVIVVLVGAVGYFAFVKKSEPVAQQPTPTQTKTPISPTPTPTSKVTNLKTYTNTQYGFEFQYSDSIKTVKPTDYTNGQQPDVIYFQTLEYSGKEASPAQFKNGMLAKILAFTNNQNLSLSDFAKTLYFGTPSETTTIINGQSAIVLTYSSSNINPEREAPYNFKNYIFQKGSMIFEIEGMTNYKPATQSHIQLFEQVVSTFKFTK